MAVSAQSANRAGVGTVSSSLAVSETPRRRARIESPVRQLVPLAPSSVGAVRVLEILSLFDGHRDPTPVGSTGP